MHPSSLLLLPASQVELRILAHLSQDPERVTLLRRAGPEGDAFRLIASTWLGAGELRLCVCVVVVAGVWGGGCGIL